MSQSFSLAANSRARHHLRQFEGMGVAPGSVEDHMQAHHLRPEGTEAVDLQNAMTFIDPRLRQDRDLLFVLGHIPLDLAHHRRAEVVLVQTRGIVDAGAQATAAMVTAVEVAVQTGTVAITELKHPDFCGLVSCCVLAEPQRGIARDLRCGQLNFPRKISRIASSTQWSTNSTMTFNVRIARLHGSLKVVSLYTQFLRSRIDLVILLGRI